mmetsp:Transcript_19225/g.55914  ORF Transcript_19225/g.55914 Transcript_19225/m.55914 type:complete len:251 (-) Transcript_19225:3276-4028(-)
MVDVEHCDRTTILLLAARLGLADAARGLPPPQAWTGGRGDSWSRGRPCHSLHWRDPLLALAAPAADGSRVAGRGRDCRTRAGSGHRVRPKGSPCEGLAPQAHPAAVPGSSASIPSGGALLVHACGLRFLGIPMGVSAGYGRRTAPDSGCGDHVSRLGRRAHRGRQAPPFNGHCALHRDGPRRVHNSRSAVHRFPAYWLPAPHGVPPRPLCLGVRRCPRGQSLRPGQRGERPSRRRAKPNLRGGLGRSSTP